MTGDKTPRRRVRWPLALLGLLLFPLLLLLVPLVHPVTLRWGGTVAIIGSAPMHPRAVAEFPHFFHQIDYRMRVGALLPLHEGRVLYAMDPLDRTVHGRWLRLGHWHYYVTWFKGRRVR